MISEHDRAVLNSIFNPSLPVSETVNEPHLLFDKEEENEDTDKAKSYEIEAIQKAELGSLDEAIDLLTNSIKIARRASAYNNRAQVYRLKGDMSAAMTDLNAAINLSQEKGLSGRQALCQRGILYRHQGKDEQAKQDFKVAAQLGSQFAKAQLIEMNPYAALCNQMLVQMIQKTFTPPAQV